LFCNSVREGVAGMLSRGGEGIVGVYLFDTGVDRGVDTIFGDESGDE
jgi:hypothetical protein